MSEGPIKAWRDAWKPPIVSTRQSGAVHAERDGRAYCGRKGAMSKEWSTVTCSDCHAAHRADEGRMTR